MQTTVTIPPAEHVISAFDGVRPLARILGLNPSAVCRWNKPKSERGSAGEIPSAHHKAILKEAKARKLDVTAEDLIYGRRIRVRNPSAKMENA